MDMALLAPLFGTDVGYWKPLMIIYPVFMVVAGIWVYVDANERVGNGCFWGGFAFAVPAIGLPLYYIMVIVYHIQGARGPSAQEQAERGEREKIRRKFVSQGELERQQFLDNAEQEGGTLYNPLTGMGSKGQGHKHFADQYAEELIQACKYEEAEQYLVDLLGVAKQENDGRAADTYTYYLSKLPGKKSPVEGE